MGMDLRDYFAAKALGGLLTKRGCVGASLYPKPAEWEREANVCYAIADAMLAARNKKPE